MTRATRRADSRHEVNPDIVQVEGSAATGTESQRDQSLGTCSFDDILLEIDAAIDKVETGRGYGLCEITGPPIPPSD